MKESLKYAKVCGESDGFKLDEIWWCEITKVYTKGNRFWQAKFVSATVSCVSHSCLGGTQALFPARDLKFRFKSLAAYGFFREGVWGMTLFSPEKRVSPKRKEVF